MENFDVTSSHCWWGRLNKIWLAFQHLHDITKLRIEFDKNRSSSFEEYLTHKYRHRRQTDRQTRTGDPFIIL